MEIRKVRKAQGGQDAASLIVSLPKQFCNQIGLMAGDAVYIDLRDKTICIGVVPTLVPSIELFIIITTRFK